MLIIWLTLLARSAAPGVMFLHRQLHLPPFCASSVVLAMRLRRNRLGLAVDRLERIAQHIDETLASTASSSPRTPSAGGCSDHLELGAGAPDAFATMASALSMTLSTATGLHPVGLLRAKIFSCAAMCPMRPMSYPITVAGLELTSSKRLPAKSAAPSSA